MRQRFPQTAFGLPGRGCAIRRSAAGEWVARERSGEAERRFASQKAALHFALFECGAHAGAALLTPPLAQEGGYDR